MLCVSRLIRSPLCRARSVPHLSLNKLGTEILPRLLPFLESRVSEPQHGETLPELNKRLQCLVAEYSELEALSKEGGELGQLAVDDLCSMRTCIEEVVEDITDVLVPPLKYDGEDAVIEVMPGAGGQEASLFAEEIFLLYVAYTQSLGFQVEVTELNKNAVVGKSSSGLTKGVASVSGDHVFSVLKFESGVHRVQRVPLTAKNDQVHTSTCSVAVLPQARNIQIKLSMTDPSLRWEYMRASGAGGQGVNTTDSAVRLTHTTSGMVVESQEERSQMQNKQKALKKLQKLLYEKEFQQDMSAISANRKFQVGNMNRNEKIRTYNFSRHMITDHRLGSITTVPKLSDWFLGKFGFEILEEFGQKLQLAEREERLDRLLTGGDSNNDNGKKKKSY